MPLSIWSFLSLVWRHSFYLLGAPFLALLEIIIYAGAIMVLFIFVVMTLKIATTATITAAWLRQWAPALGLSAISGVIMIILIWHSRPIQSMLPLAMVSPNDFGYFVLRPLLAPRGNSLFPALCSPGRSILPGPTRRQV